MLPVGNRVNYPRRGPCLVDRVSTETVGGRAIEFYHLVLLDGSGGRVLVPVDKVGAIGVRRLVKRSQVPELLGRLNEAAAAADDWKERARVFRDLLASGSAFDLAEVVGSLTVLAEIQTLSQTDRLTLDRARALLICELSEVMRKAPSVAARAVDEALGARRDGRDDNHQEAFDEC